MASGFCAEQRTHKFYCFEGFERWRDRPDFLRDVSLETQHIRPTVLDGEDEFIYKLPGYSLRVGIGDYIVVTNENRLIVMSAREFQDRYKIVEGNLL